MLLNLFIIIQVFINHLNFLFILIFIVNNIFKIHIMDDLKQLYLINLLIIVLNDLILFFLLKFLLSTHINMSSQYD